MKSHQGFKCTELMDYDNNLNIMKEIWEIDKKQKYLSFRIAAFIHNQKLTWTKQDKEIRREKMEISIGGASMRNLIKEKKQFLGATDGQKQSS